jgi:FkbM family methyltransferase
MPGARQWIGGLLLRAPSPLRSLRGFPVLGGIVHKLSHRILPTDEKVWARIEAGPARGIWIELNPRTGQNYLHGNAEPVVQAALARHLRPGMIFYDLGANVGLFSLLAARLVSETGKVFSFEPDAEIAARLRRNIARNAFTNISVVQSGVWSSSGNRNFIPSDPSSPDRGIGKFTALGERDDLPGTLTPCVSLDDFIQTAPPPEAIKCDIEGAEVEAFRGAEKLLETSRPWIICEMHSETIGQTVRNQLQRFGYTFESVDASHVLALPSRRPEDRPQYGRG